MRHHSPLVLLMALILAGLSAGCSEQQVREAGQRGREAIANRWETWREGVDRDIKAKARQAVATRTASREQGASRKAAQAATATDRQVAGLIASERAAKPQAIDQAELAAIVRIAERQRAQSLIVKVAGKTVLDRRWGRQDELHGMMQMTYAIVALTMGQLVEEGHVPSLDTPIGEWLPAFREGKKSRITIRHVMTGLDGMRSPEPFPAGLYRQPDYIGYYAEAAVPDTPGQGQVLPRESVVLLGAVVQAAAGMPLDRWVATRLFEPLGITKSRWRKDAAGNVDAWAGLWLAPADALRIGELVLNEGRWSGKQLLPREWVIEATTPAGHLLGDQPWLDAWPETHSYGWRTGVRVMFREQDVERLRSEGYAQADRVAPAVGGTYRSHQDLQRALWPMVGEAGQAGLLERHKRDISSWIPSARITHRRFGFQASSYIGHHLIVNPTKRLVALHTVPWDGRPVTRSIATFEFDDLADRLDAAVR